MLLITGLIGAEGILIFASRVDTFGFLFKI
jgi:hypothetical protein